MKLTSVPTAPQAETASVPGYPKYLVSKDGFIYDTNYYGKSGITKAICHVIAQKTGYVKVSLAATPKRKFASVHRIVALAFVPNPTPELTPDVNHKDLNKTNNSWDNLEWIAHINNIRHARAALGNWSRPNPEGFTQLKAWRYNDNEKNTELVHTFESIKQASMHFKKPYTTFAPLILRAIKNQWQAYGFYWHPQP